MNPTAILCADVHLVEPGTRPACRSDDVFLEQLSKLGAIRTLQHDHDDIPVLCAGDVFHHWRPSPRLLAAVIPLMRNWIAVPGQHDLPNHKLENYDRSGLAVLEAASCIEVLGKRSDLRYNWREVGGYDCIFVGIPWGAPLHAFEPYKGSEECRRIALVHHYVYPGSPPFPGADEYGTKAEEVLRIMTGFDLILTGDNHATFALSRDNTSEALNTDEKWCGDPGTTFGIPGGRLLVNPGPIIRLTATLADHEPSVFLWDAETNTAERVVLPHDYTAVSRDHLEEETKRDARISEFTSRLQILTQERLAELTPEQRRELGQLGMSVEGDWDTNLDFRLNLERAIATGRVPDPIRDIVWEIVDQKGA